MNNEDEQGVVPFSPQESAPGLDELALEEITGAGPVFSKAALVPVIQGPLQFPVHFGEGARITPEIHTRMLERSTNMAERGMKVTSVHVYDRGGEVSITYHQESHRSAPHA